MAGTAQNTTTLQSYFETGDIPTQAQFENLMQSFANLVDSNLLIGKSDPLLTVFPASQGTAAAITKLFTRLTTPGGGIAGAIVPASSIGKFGFIYNSGADIVNVYPPSGGGWKNASANVPFKLQTGESMIYFCCDTDTYVGVKFIDVRTNATVYRAYVTQTGTSAPSATVLESNMPTTISWSRLAAGVYTLTATGLFVSGKFYVQITPVSNSIDDVNVFFSDNFGDVPDEVYVNHVDDSFAHVDGCKFYIEIKIYP